MILKWRTRKDITKYMNSDIEYNLENQKNGMNLLKMILIINIGL